MPWSDISRRVKNNTASSHQIKLYPVDDLFMMFIV